MKGLIKPSSLSAFQVMYQGCLKTLKTMVMSYIFSCFIVLSFIMEGKPVDIKTHVGLPQQNAGVRQLTPEETEILLFIREQQWMTSDVCNYFLVIYPMPEFQQIGLSNLNQSEVAHSLLIKNQIKDPVIPHFPGRYSNSGITVQYNNLTSNGKTSQAEALLSCFDLGEYNLYRYLQFKPKVANPDLLNLLSILIRCIQDHIRALYKQANERKLTFSPQYISRAQLDSILMKPQGWDQNSQQPSAKP
ncbi:MAG: hypothetical protein CVU06_07700 [Bacteroidetes bacterium HGW-Bacteroidetes-22]|nr:MAG: hypothetical protein CVU06_07700 [Bacteroidetes bacterium HGW-Bacteroidetes-22]